MKAAERTLTLAGSSLTLLFSLFLKSTNKQPAGLLLPPQKSKPTQQIDLVTVVDFQFVWRGQ
jgi:hypothetical protein